MDLAIEVVDVEKRCRTWRCRTWRCRTWRCRTWRCRTWRCRTWRCRTWRYRTWRCRTWFDAVTVFLPRVSTLGQVASDLARGKALSAAHLRGPIAGFMLFAAAPLSSAVWACEKKDS
jgi:hypothetical protein